MNLQQLRDAVRAQLDVDEEELPNPLLDLYLREGYTRTINVQTRWPFFESSWNVSNTGGGRTIVIPLDVQIPNIQSIVKVGAWPLTQIAYELAESQFADGATGGGNPSYYSVWGGTIYLWPTPSNEFQYTLRGYRRPIDWISQGSSTECDADPSLHVLLVHYAVALAYAQQEDEVLENVYMSRWQQNLNVLVPALIEPPHNHPLVLSSGIGAGYGVTVNWDLPVT